jgi:hypothetical protein
MYLEVAFTISYSAIVSVDDYNDEETICSIVDDLVYHNKARISDREGIDGITITNKTIL